MPVTKTRRLRPTDFDILRALGVSSFWKTLTEDPKDREGKHFGVRRSGLRVSGFGFRVPRIIARSPELGTRNAKLGTPLQSHSTRRSPDVA